ncbi:MAG: c-type cytochrome biogenesis protein CcsB [Mariprofundaceae bacterium]|nr:c-type cytochrome biogenesis protein CcsB [Mariprofundaceae bacterium]
MTAIALPGFFSGIQQARVSYVRFWTYIGLLTGAAALAFFGGSGYDEDGFLIRFLSMQGVIWGGAGALLGLGLSFAVGKPAQRRASFAENVVPWFDGLLLMTLLMAVLTLLEPHEALISYEDQSNLISGRIVMAMNLLFLFSAVCYIMYLFAPESFIGKMATMAAWGGVYTGGTSLLLRWYESYLFLDGDIGHAPVSNLYEVFILLFCITSCIYLTFERRYQAKALGAFVMVLVAAGIFFGIWLDSIGQADIKPLVPALQSYWMKIHVPLNFVGYGAFAVACAAGMAWLFRERLERKGSSSMLKIFPSLDQLDQLAYKSVAIGFPAFTLATILGAAWAAEAWGGYWSWDPKETWALIVWLFYGAYLHVRISHGWSGKTLAVWAVAGFLVTLFCFVGVNMYLSGLHSYGKLS